MLRKNEFVKRLAEKGYTFKDASVIIDDVLKTIDEILADGESVCFRGFGTFSVVTRKPKRLYNVNTKELTELPEHDAPRFEAGSALKRTVRDRVSRL